MASAEGSYSRLVAWLKILLPLAALVLLSTMFLLARRTEPTGTLPFAESLAGGSSGEQIGSPYFAGSTARGDMVTMTARRARPEGKDTILADDVAATLTLTDGSRINLNAADATLRDATNQVLLQGGVVVRSSRGYSLKAEGFRSALDRIEGESLGPVSGTGPAGTLEAGKMRIDTDAAGAVQLLFTDGVKLVYLPQS